MAKQDAVLLEHPDFPGTYLYTRWTPVQLIRRQAEIAGYKRPTAALLNPNGDTFHLFDLSNPPQGI